MSLGALYQEWVGSEIEAHAEYRDDPIRWAVERLGIPEHTVRWSLSPGYETHVWDGTRDPLATAFEAIAEWKDCAIESGTGVGKSFGAAILILWFIACWENAQVWTFALTEDQLKDYIWRNITELWPRFSAWFPSAKLGSLSIRMRGGIDETWAAKGKAVQLKSGEKIASRAQGMHEENMLLVYEEAASMEWSIVEAGMNTCTRPHNLRLFIGNPNHQLDSLHKVSQQAGVVAVRASALDHPNIVSGNPDLVPGTISQAKIDTRKAEYGEDSPNYKTRVRGISPEEATDALFRKAWLDASAARYAARKLAGTLPHPRHVTGKGVDVANSENGDKAAICDFTDNVVSRLTAFPCPDCNVLGTNVAAEMVRDDVDRLRVGVDVTGVGAGTYNELRRLKKVVQAIWFGGKPIAAAEKAEDGQTVEWSPDVNKFYIFRDQLYWQARVDLQDGVIDMPYDKELWEELLAMTFEEDPKVAVLEKAKIREALHRSPDKADAFVMANWVRKRAVKAKTPERLQGQSLGYDYKNKRPAERLTAEQELQQTLRRAQPNVIGSRYSIPNRRGR